MSSIFRAVTFRPLRGLVHLASSIAGKSLSNGAWLSSPSSTCASISAVVSMGVVLVFLRVFDFLDEVACMVCSPFHECLLHC